MTEDAPGELRMAGALTLPAKVLRKYHRGLIRLAAQEDSEAFDELVADGVLEIVRLHHRVPPGEDEFEFRVRAVSVLMFYYRRRYRELKGVYRARNGDLRTKQKRQRVDFDKLVSNVAVPDLSVSLWIEVEDFLEGLTCDDGGQLRWASRRDGSSGRRLSELKKWLSEPRNRSRSSPVESPGPATSAF